MISIHDPQGDRTTLVYDEANRLTVERLTTGARTSFAYDAANQLLGLHNRTSTGTLVFDADYQYDDAGNRVSMREADGARTTWTYDDTNQLLSEHRTGTQAWRNTFTYDPAGNRTLKNEDATRTTSTYDAANQLAYSETTTGRTRAIAPCWVVWHNWRNVLPAAC